MYLAKILGNFKVDIWRKVEALFDCRKRGEWLYIIIIIIIIIIIMCTPEGGGSTISRTVCTALPKSRTDVMIIIAERTSRILRVANDCVRIEKMLDTARVWFTSHTITNHYY